MAPRFTFAVQVAVLATACAESDPPQSCDSAEAGAGGSAASGATLVYLQTPLAEGNVQIACAEGTLVLQTCVDAPTCSDVTMSVEPALRAQSAFVTISSKGRALLLNADWSVLYGAGSGARGDQVEALEFYLMNDTRDNSCFLFPKAMRVNGSVVSGPSPGSALAYEACGPFR